MLSVKQGGIKYHFLSLWYDSTWDWTQVSQAIGEHSNHYTTIYVVIWIEFTCYFSNFQFYFASVWLDDFPYAMISLINLLDLVTYVF